MNISLCPGYEKQKNISYLIQVHQEVLAVSFVQLIQLLFYGRKRHIVLMGCKHHYLKSQDFLLTLQNFRIFSCIQKTLPTFYSRFKLYLQYHKRTKYECSLNTPWCLSLEKQTNSFIEFILCFVY